MKLQTVRNITKFVIGTSVWWTVHNIIKNNVTPEKRKQKVEAYIGTAAIGWVVKDQADIYIDRKFDKLVELWKKNDKKIEIEPETIVGSTFDPNTETLQNLETKNP